MGTTPETRHPQKSNRIKVTLVTNIHTKIHLNCKKSAQQSIKILIFQHIEKFGTTNALYMTQR